LNQVEGEIGRRDFEEFVKLCWPILEPGVTLDWAPYLTAICKHLEAVYDGDIQKLIINIPPRHLKTNIVSVMYTAWCWVRNPGFRTLCGSYSMMLSTRDSQRVRRMVQDPLFQARWPHVQLRDDASTQIRLGTVEQGLRYACSVGSAVTGEGGDQLILDDPISADDAESEARRRAVQEWLTSTWASRLNDLKKGRQVIIMQRLHEDDPTGFLVDGDPTWEHLVLPLEADLESACPIESAHRCSAKEGTSLGYREERTAQDELLMPNRIGPKEVETLKASMSDYAVAGQLQQRPSPKGGGIVREEWFKTITKAELPSKMRRVTGWDLAATEGGGDWTVRVEMGWTDQMIYVLEVERRQLDVAEVRAWVRDTADTNGDAVIVRMPQEPAAAGKTVKKDFHNLLTGYNVKSEPAGGSKLTRATAFASALGSDNVRLVAGPWVRRYIREWLGFPMGKHDDQVDATSEAMREVVESRRARVVYNRELRL
jgi:predicted phage terminase large subunit-like protein